jgi:hypothetical protein
MFPRKISSSVIEACLPVKVIERGLYKDNFTITKRMQLCVMALDSKEIANYFFFKWGQKHCPNLLIKKKRIAQLINGKPSENCLFVSCTLVLQKIWETELISFVGILMESDGTYFTFVNIFFLP